MRNCYLVDCFCGQQLGGVLAKCDAHRLEGAETIGIHSLMYLSVSLSV